ncbi:MAG: hypothetical protein GY714_06230 [Desulfobacterales bacterium]|nr:hypothetical protein [Desulfobacterales bacterium]
MIQGFIKDKIKEVIIASMLFILSMPFFIAVMTPHRDVSYHFFNGKPSVLSTSNIQNNSFITTKRKINLKSIVLNTNFLKTNLNSLNFRLEGLPQTLVFHLHKGPLFKKIKKLYKSSLVNTVANKTQKNRFDDSERSKNVFDLLSNTDHIFKGRIYSSDNFLEPFANFYNGDDADISGYYYEIGEKFEGRASIENFFAGLAGEKVSKNKYYLVNINETPSLDNFFETFAIIFIVIPTIAIIIFIVLVMRSSGKKTKL